MKKGFILTILMLIALGTFACNTEDSNNSANSNKTEDANIQEIETLTHTWEEGNLQFEHASNYNVHDSKTALFISTSSSIIPPPGEVMMELMLTSSDKPLEENISFYENYQEHTKTNIQIGDHEVSLIQYISELVPDYTYTVFILETETGTISFVPGLGHEDLGKEILESVKFL